MDAITFSLGVVLLLSAGFGFGIITTLWAFDRSQS